MKTTLTLLALGLAAWISVPAAAADDYPQVGSFPTESAPADSGKSTQQDAAPAAGAPSSDATTPEVAPADNSMGSSNDTSNKSEDKPAGAP